MKKYFPTEKSQDAAFAVLSAIAEQKDELQSLSKKAENLWQTLAAVKMQLEAGLQPDTNVLKEILKENRLNLEL